MKQAWIQSSLAVVVMATSMSFAQVAPQSGTQRAPPPTLAVALAGAGKLDIVEGSSATYRATETFVGVDFPDDAVGTTNEVAGHIEIRPDGSVAPGSKLTVALKNLKTDQSHRDEYVSAKVLETAKFPDAVFTPTAIKAVPTGGGHYGVTLSGDMTIHGVTKPMSFRGIATVDPKTMMVYGSAATSFTFADFNLFKPKIGPLVAMEDKITLDLVFKFKQS